MGEPEEDEKGDEPELVWHVLRTYRNKQQMSLRDSRMNVPEDHPSAADPITLVKLVEPLTVRRIAEDSQGLGGS